MDWGVIVATLVGPILAVQAQKWIKRWKEDGNRRVGVFKTLMATRGAVVSFPHVQALNQIDLEFRSDEFKPVRSAWRTYLDHLNSYPEGSIERPIQEATQIAWNDRRMELLTTMLVAMGRSLKFPFDEVDIKRGAYVPKAHSEQEAMVRALLALAGRTFAGETAIRVNIDNIPRPGA